MKLGVLGVGTVNGGTSSQPHDRVGVAAVGPLQEWRIAAAQLEWLGNCLVAGSTPHLSVETRDLLRSRLRIVASLLFVCFLVYIVRWAFHWSEWNDAVHHLLFSILCVVAVVLGLLTLALWRKALSR